jgi:hypothetical protein
VEHDVLRELIRDKLADGRLPQNSISRVWGGAGNSEMCVACEGIGAGLKAIQFHVRCFYYWDAERTPPGR